jgi:hypothetical protein
MDRPLGEEFDDGHALACPHIGPPVQNLKRVTPPGGAMPALATCGKTQDAGAPARTFTA